MTLIAITGGIGSGKSVVSRVLRVMGFEAYDCDSRAQELMVNDEQVKRELVEAFGELTYLPDGTINRPHLSAVAFADPSALARLNGIVHPAVARDIQRWARQQAESGACAAFVETALLRTAALDAVVDSVWHVTAPVEVRVDRVITRSGLTEQQVLDRIAAQATEDAVAPGEHVIINDGHKALLPQVMELLKRDAGRNN